MLEKPRDGRERASPRERTAAVRDLYERHKDEVFGFLVAHTGDRALAEDLLHESFLKVHASFERYDEDRPFRPWLFEIVRNTATSARRKRTEKPLDGVPPGAISDRLLRDLTTREAVAQAKAALAALGDEDRALLIQRHGLGMKLEELAVAMNVTERTVRNRLRAAGEEFTRAWLARKEGGLS
jgi:RNA polymerase sigma-70 factor (ECF subfamily)